MVLVPAVREWVWCALPVPSAAAASVQCTALVRLDKAAAAVAVQVETLKAEDKLYALGKDRLAEIDQIMFEYALGFSPEKKDEKGNPCRPFWKNPADEMKTTALMESWQH